MSARVVQLMVLPSALADAAPQIYYEDGGMWRETIPNPAALVMSKVRQTLEGHLGTVMQRVGGVPAVPVVARTLGFRNPFHTLLQGFLPTDLQTKLTKVADSAPANEPPLLKIFFGAGAEWIPWELLHDGQDFLGLRFSVTRLPIVREAIDPGAATQREVRSVYSLLARGVLKEPVRAAWQATFEPFATGAGWEHRYPANGQNDFPSLNQLEQATAADILHFTCHGGLKDGTDYYWTLDHENPLYTDYRITASVAKGAKLGARPLVFGNACTSAAATGGDLGTLLGFGASFMIGGALNFVGTCAPITQRTAIAFASRFYSQLFGANGNAPAGVAEAVLRCKRSFADENYDDPSYLFYCLYGPPDTHYQPAA